MGPKLKKIRFGYIYNGQIRFIMIKDARTRPGSDHNGPGLPGPGMDRSKRSVDLENLEQKIIDFSTRQF